MNSNKTPMLSIEQVKTILQPQFEYLGKSHGEMLWLHSFSVWSILSKLAARIPRFTERERLLLEVSALIHDVGKLRTENQAVLQGLKQGRVKHTASKEEIEEYLSRFVDNGTLQLNQEEIGQIWEFTLHHHISDEQQKDAKTAAYGIYAEVVRYADWLSSMRKLDMTLLMQISNGLEGICRITAFSVGRYPSPSTYHLLQEASQQYRMLGWEILVVLDNSVIFVGGPSSPSPDRQQIVKSFAAKLMAKSFEDVSIQIKYMRYEILSGQAKDNPCGFLQAKRGFYEDKLGDIDTGPVLFFKTLINLYNNSNRLTASGKNTMPILGILNKAGGTNGITPAKKEWNKIQGASREWPSTNAFIADIFSKVVVREVLADITAKAEKQLKDLTAKELFGILEEAATKWFPESLMALSRFEERVSDVVSMEEETDFAAFAQDALNKYKRYKQSRKPTTSICEQCGFTETRQATASLNFPKYSGFTQINPRPESDAPRMVCPLCIFDALQTRKELKQGKSQIYARITSRIPELWQINGDLRSRVDRLRQSLTNVRELQELSGTEFADLPLPPHIAIPILRRYSGAITNIPLNTEFGVLLPIERVNNDASPKDLRAKYLAFYALLNMLGFDVHLGLEEQDGLFGETVFEKREGDWTRLYYKGLVTVILANHIEKNNRYVFARDLLERSPSVTLSRIEAAKIKREVLEKLIVFLMHIDSVIIESKGGVWKMKEILQDAAFFAEWVPKFFWTQKDYDSWRTGGSKYVVTKPVDRALNAILQGDDFEEAYAKFLSGLKEDISGDKAKEGSKATVDVRDLEAFAVKAKEVFQRYQDLRDQNVTKFIQAKNGLRSAIYIVKRYETLREVIKNESA